jgi:hypothetical protein
VESPFEMRKSARSLLHSGHAPYYSTQTRQLVEDRP